MARVTIHDSLKNCPNMFYLLRLASFRAHQLQNGATPKVSRAPKKNKPDDAPTVLALREIAAGFVDFENEVIPKKDYWVDKAEESNLTKSKITGIVAKDRSKEE